MAWGESEAACLDVPVLQESSIELPRGSCFAISWYQAPSISFRPKRKSAIVYNRMSSRGTREWSLGNGWSSADLADHVRSWRSTIYRRERSQWHRRDIIHRGAIVSSRTSTKLSCFPREIAIGNQRTENVWEHPAEPTRRLFHDYFTSSSTLDRLRFTRSTGYVAALTREAMPETSWRWSIARSNAPDSRSITSKATRFSLDSTYIFFIDLLHWLSAIELKAEVEKNV